MAKTKSMAARLSPRYVDAGSNAGNPFGDTHEAVATDEVNQDNVDEYDADEDDAYEDDVDDGADEKNGVGIEEEACEVLGAQFGEVANDGDENDDEDSADDIWDDDRIPDPLSSDDEEGDARRESNEDRASSDEILVLGKTFGCAEQFKQAVLRYSLKSRYDVKLMFSAEKKLAPICSDKSCPWRAYCAYERRKHKMQIKVYINEHTCVRSGYSKMLKTSSIASLYSERLRVNPKMTAKEIEEDFHRNYNLIITENQCRKAKTKITRQRRASHEAHFSRVWDYEAELIKSNPGTSVEIQTFPGATPGSKQRFDRIYICFEAQRLAWKSTCRPIIGLDGAFLKWDVKGHLIAAVGRDGDNRIVPLAWAVVEIENDDNWAWFVNQLKTDLQLGDGSNIVMISDKQQGILKAVKNDLPEVEHRLCARHILGNWKRDSHDTELERLFWLISRSYTLGDYQDHMKELEAYSKGAHESLLKTSPEKWSRAFFKVGSYCNDNLNNLNESFNRTIKEARRKPLLELLEDIRRQCMVRTAKRFVLANRLNTKFTKSAHKEIETAIEKSKDCKRYMATGDVHEIDYHGCSYRVDMVSQRCGCGKWRMVGIPCIHAACVILAKKEQVDDYVCEFYTTQIWRKTYEHGIQPVQGMKLWPRLNRLHVLPPPDRLGNRGRPNNRARRKSIGESSSKSTKTKLSREKRIMTCSRCREEGHTKAVCTRPMVVPPPKIPRGRPRKCQLDQASQIGSQVGSQVGSQAGSQFGSQAGSQVQPPEGSQA